MPVLPTDGAIFDTYADVAAALANQDLTRSIDVDRYERNSILENVLMMLSGAEHRSRRRVENSLFRRETLEAYERRLFPEIIDRTLDLLIQGGRADLLNIGALLTVGLSAKTAGVDIDPSSIEQRLTLVRLLRVFARGIAIDAGTEEVEVVKGDVREALDEFESDFYRQSFELRRKAVSSYRAGSLGEDQLPLDILTTLLLHGDETGLTESELVRETAFFLEAGAHTSSQSLASSMHHLFEWLAADPGRAELLLDDDLLVQRCVHEALRLRPTNPLIRRRAARATSVNGTTLEAGALAYLNTYAANRDVAVFGPDAERFDPYRPVPGTASRYGHSFGGGIHACIGRTLAIGYPIRSQEPGSEHLYGLVSVMVRALLARGVRPDPAMTPTLDEQTTRWTRWSGYPVIVEGRATAPMA